MIEFSCPRCRKKLKAQDEAAGKHVKCPGCGQAVRVPEAVASPSPAPEGKTPGRGEAGPEGEGSLPPPRAGSIPAAPAAGEGATLRAVNAPAQGGPDLEGSRADTLGDADQGEGAELTDFLGPALAPDEIGRLGPYRVLQVLGAGGMGVVYKAEDPQLQRLVALKAMLPALAASASARQRFLREARAAAAIKHDHIVAIYQVGEDRGVPFLAMEFLEGEALDARLKREPPLSLGEMLRIGRQTALGLAAAHARGLVHRDIKPANLWLDSAAGGRVKILDFGLARGGGEQSQLTQQGALVGTPAYMAPEQAQGDKVDARGDLFSLGCVLYRLVTGELPFKGPDAVGTIVAVVTEEPRPPREITPETPADLSDLVMRLLAKKPEDRPTSAQAVVEALAAIDSERTDLTPAPSRAALRPARKKPGGTRRRALVLAAAGLLLAVGVAAGIYALTRPADRGPPQGAGLDPPKDDGNTVGDPLSPLALVSRPPPIPGIQSWSIEPRGHRGPISVVAYSQDSKRLASGGDDGTVRLWDPKDGRLLSVFLGHANKVTTLAWSPDGTVLASGSDDRTVRLWQADTGKLLFLLAKHTGPVRTLAWSPDGKTLASGSADKSVRLWDPATGESRRTFDVHKDPVVQVTWQSASTILSASKAGGPKKTFWLWDAGSGKTLHSHEAPGEPAWTADRKIMVYKTADDTVDFWEVAANKTRSLTLKDHQGPIRAFDISPDGTMLATGGKNMVQWWDAATGKALTVSEQQPRNVTAVMFSPDGRTLVSLGENGGEVWLWKTDPGQKTGAASPFKSGLLARNRPSWTGWSPDSKTLVAGQGEAAGFWDAASGKALYTLPMHWPGNDVAWAPDGKRLAVSTINHQGTLWIWEADTGAFVRAVAGAGPGGRGGEYVDWSGDGKTLATSAVPYTVALWDVQSGKPGPSLSGHTSAVIAAVFSPDSKKLASCGRFGDNNKVRIFDVAGGQGIDLPAAEVVDQALGWSPDSRSLATGGSGVRVWDANTGKPLPLNLTGLKSRVHAVAWSPDGLTLAAGNALGTVALWNAQTGAPLRQVQAHDGPVHALAWLADSKTLASLGEQDGSVRFWQTDADRSPRSARGLPGKGRFSPDRRYLVSRFDPTRVQVWETETGRLRGSFIHLSGEPDQFLAVAADGHYRISGEPWRHVVYVAQTAAGQETLGPEEFEKKYPWKNDPEKVRLASPP
jgi:WD40 repeat protein